MHRLGTWIAYAVVLAQGANTHDWKPKVDALVRPAVESEVVIGLVIGIVHGGQTQTFGYGRLTHASNQVPDEDTLFEIGSVTKVFTALALADMVREKRVALDDPVRKWLPQGVKVPSREGKEITLEHLATHTSGLPRLGRRLERQALENPLDPYAQFTVEDLYATLAEVPLSSTPGTRYAYSNLGFGLLGHVLARHAGSSYEELILRRICRPLGMTSTTVRLSEEQKARLAQGHDIDGQPLPPWNFPTLAGAGAIRSNVRDLLRFVQANLQPTRSPLREAIELTHVPRYDTDLPHGRIALGWHGNAKTGILWHNGQTGGYHSYVGLDRQKQIGVVVLGNTAGGTVDAIGERLLKLLDGQTVEPLKLKVPRRLPPELLDQYVGNYEMLPNVAIHVTREGDRLWAQATNQPRLRIYPETDTTFFYRAVDARITFVRGADGRVNKLVVHQHGLDWPAWKGGLIVGLGGQMLRSLRNQLVPKPPPDPVPAPKQPP